MATTPALCCPPPGPGLRPHPVLSTPAGPNPNADFELTCGVDPATGHQVYTKWDTSQTPSTVVERLDATTGAAWAGDPTTLEPCGGSSAESDIYVMCDNGTPFMRHYVKKDGEPTGAKFDTALDGTPHIVADESLVTPGECKAAAVQGMSSATAADLSTLDPGTSFAVYKPDCCVVQLVTSIGVIVIPKTATAYSTQIYKDPFTVDAVNVLSGVCDPESIAVISNLSY